MQTFLFESVYIIIADRNIGIARELIRLSAVRKRDDFAKRISQYRYKRFCAGEGILLHDNVYFAGVIARRFAHYAERFPIIAIISCVYFSSPYF